MTSLKINHLTVGVMAQLLGTPATLADGTAVTCGLTTFCNSRPRESSTLICVLWVVGTHTMHL